MEYVMTPLIKGRLENKYYKEKIKKVYCLNWPILSLSILFILFSMFFVLINDYTLCFTGSPCCNFSYYNYIYIWPYYIVIHLLCPSMGVPSPHHEGGWGGNQADTWTMRGMIG